MLLVVPASAGAAVTLDEFTVTPGSTQAGSHPDLTLFQRMTPSAGDDVKDTFVRLAPGLLGNPQSAALCSREQLSRAEVTLPLSVAPNQAALMRSCLREQANATACPESSRVGTAIIDSPLQAEPVSGPVYLALNTPAPLPGLMVVLPPPVDLRLDGVVETGSFG